MQKNFENILFDLDGTLTDPALGITTGIQISLRHFGIDVKDRAELYPFIGPPLVDSYQRYYGFTKEQAEEAIAVYREYFGVTGLFENEVYPGIVNMLKELKEAGKHLYLATSKPTGYSVRIMEHFDLSQYFDGMIGATMDSSRVEKCDVIAYILKEFKLTDLSHTVMVGDRKYDITGGKQCDLETVGVLYGYGSREELEEASADFIAETVEDLKNCLLL